MIIFLIGASGSGKTTLTKALEKKRISNLKLLYFDSIGIPSIEEMKTKYGGPEEWQKIKTSEWVKVIKRDFLPNTNVFFDCQTRPSFIERACHENGIVRFVVILLDCSDDERKKRLLDRGQNELVNDNMMNWAQYLRRECQDRGYQIIDNTFLEVEETIFLLPALG